jgi:hypothetical protein
MIYLGHKEKRIEKEVPLITDAELEDIICGRNDTDYYDTLPGGENDPALEGEYGE